MNVPPRAATAWRTALLIFAAGITAQSVWVSWGEVQTYGGYDLRNRVVGARVLAAGIDPYTFVYRDGMPLEWADPVARPGVPRVTVPPTALCMYAPFAKLSFKTQRDLWWMLEWLALAAGCALLAWTLRQERGRIAWLVLATGLFACGYFWHRHLVRGQYYVFEMLLLALSSALFLRRRRVTAWAGVPLGLAAALRPTLVVSIAFLWLLRERKTAWAAAATLAFSILASLPVAGSAVWWSYLNGMELHERDVQPAQTLDTYVNLPREIEGVELRAWLPDRSANLTFPAALRSLAREFDGLAFLETTSSNGKLACCILLLVFAGAIRFRSRKPLLARHTLAIAFCAGLATDYFLPVRWAYVDVLLLLPLALLLPILLHRRLPPWPVVLIAGGLILGHLLNNEIGSLYRAWLFGAGVCWLMGMLLAKRVNPNSAR